MCDCITKMDEHLKEHNSRLQVTFCHEGKQLVCRPYLGTEKINKRDRRVMGAIPSFCPFCGEKYGADAALAACGEG